MSEIHGPIETDENPFYCLLDDDCLITNVSVTTDRLLTPKEGTEKINDVMLIIHVLMIDSRGSLGGNRLP